MKKQLATIALVLMSLCISAFGQGTAFTYQGRLNTTNGPVTGNYDFRFRLYADPQENTAQVGGTYVVTNVPVNNGLFTTTMDFGPGIFTGTNLWLELVARTNGTLTWDTPPSVLSPIMPTPYAIFANTASNLSGALPVAQLSGVVPLSQLPASVITTNQAGTLTVYHLDFSGSNNLITLNGTNAMYIGPKDNFFIGANAGNPTLTGISNTAVGASALSHLTSGSWNTAVGNFALQADASGNDNTALGNYALQANTSGIQNIGIGSGSLQLNTTGGQNTAIGWQALLGNNASYNTADGYQALFANTAGAYNVAVGALALRNNNANANTAVGEQALQYNVSGVNSVAVGYEALQYNTTGYSVAFGTQALQNNTTGQGNTALGNVALNQNVNGNYGSSTFVMGS